MLLRINAERRKLLVVVLHLQRSAVRDQRAVRQADTQRGANFGTFGSKTVVILPVDIARDNQVVLENFESLPGNHVNSKK